MANLDPLRVRLSLEEAERAIRQLREFSAGVERGEQRLRRMGESMSRVGRQMSTRVTLPLVALGAVAVKMASDAEEVANKFDVVMGPAADRVRGQLEKLTETIPLTRTELEKMASGVQDFLVPLGFARDDAAGMSVAMVELAGDLASFNNVSADIPLEAMKSALAGMSRPMRQFGVDVSQTRLESLALEEGLISKGQALDSAARAQAIFTAIQRDSADAMGDAERTIGSTANQMRFLRRDVKQLTEDIGRELLPVANKMVGGFRDVVGVWRDLSDEQRKMIVLIGGVVAAMGPALLMLGSMTRSVLALRVAVIALRKSMLFTPGGAVLVGLGLLAGGLTVLRFRAKELSEETRALRGEMEELAVAARGFDLERAEREFRDLAEKSEEAKEEIVELEGQLEELRKTAPVRVGVVSELPPRVLREIGELEEKLRNLRADEESRAKPLAVLSQRWGELITTARRVKAAQDDLRRSLEDGRQGTEDLETEVERLIARLEEQERRTRMSERELLKWTLATEGATEAERRHALALFDSIQALERLNNIFRQAQDAVDAARTPAEEFLETQRALNIALAFGEITLVEYTRALAALRDLPVEAAGEFSRLEMAIAGVAMSGASAISDMALSGELSVRRFVEASLREFARLLAQFALFQGLSAIFPGAGFLSAFGRMTGFGGFQHGGQFQVAGGGGPDSQVVAFRATPGEIVTVTQPHRQGQEQPGGTLVVRLDTASLPPRPRTLTPEGAAQEDWWRRAFSALKVDYDDRGGR